MKKKINYLIVIFTIVFISIRANAEIKGSVSLNNSYIENPFHFAGSNPLTNHSINIKLSNNISGSDFGFNFMGNYSLLPQLSNSSVSDNFFQFAYTTDLDKDGTMNLSFLPYLGIGLNSGDLTGYNNFSLSVLSTLSNNFSESSIGRIGYRGIYKNYYYSQSLSFSDQVAFIGFQQFLETNTSINSELNLGYKNYTGKLFSFSNQKFSKNQSETASQLTANIKVGQSLADKTGLSLMYSQSWNIGSSNAIKAAFNPNLIFDKEIYDDPYSYESRETIATLTHFFDNEYKVQLSGFYFDKNYNYNFDFSYDNDVVKMQDNSYGFGLNIEKVFNNQFLVFTATKLSLNYQYLDNSSNSSIFNYISNEIGFNIKMNF
ncbi:MAG: hypothetical protein HW421_1546 [Ignavibacteria bacterium]|nr:hypothetical protein [Ignavibacteria bacterium]